MTYFANNGAVSIVNSTTALLSGGATFTGTGERNAYAQVGVMCKADVAGTLYFDFSNDGVTWHSTYPVSGFACAANVSEFHTAVKLGRYFRARYVNGSAAQATFTLVTYYGNHFAPSVSPLNQSASLDQDAIFTRSTVAQDEIRIGRRDGVIGWTKLGGRIGLTAAGGEETVWPFSTNFTPMTTASTFTITYNNATDGAAREAAYYILHRFVGPATNGYTHFGLHRQ